MHMITGQPLNRLETATATQLLINISQYKIFINGKPYDEYIQSLNDNDFKKNVISRTLCNKTDRTSGLELLRILFPHSKRLPAEALTAAGDKNPDIWGMSYNSARDKLFHADRVNNVVRSMRVRDNGGDLRDVCRGTEHDTSPYIWSVCHMSESDTLLVCSYEKGPDGNQTNWLVALSRNGSECRETHRVRIEAGP